MRRAAAVLVLMAGACAKEQPKADSATAGAPAGASATATTPAPTTVDTTRAPVSPATRGDPVQTTQNTPIPTGDVITGRVAEHGADPNTFVAITPASGAQIHVAGSQLAALRAVQGADVWARGRRDGDTFIVDTFEVRRANEEPVEDGVVSVSGTTVTVRTARATLTYPDAPTSLRNAAGARIWITRPVTGQAPTFGIIRTTTKQLRR